MKSRRQSKILEIVTQNVVETQEDLAELLQEAGYQVTQATVSRDIRELKLTKILLEDGRQKYAVLTSDTPDAGKSGRHNRILKEALISMDTAVNILVIRTSAGMGMAVATAVDALHLDAIVGSLAGDDTVFCAAKSVEAAVSAMQRIRESMESET